MRRIGLVLGWVAFLAGALSLSLGLVTLGAGTPPERLLFGLVGLGCGLFVLGQHGTFYPKD